MIALRVATCNISNTIGVLVLIMTLLFAFLAAILQLYANLEVK
jgi:hypothetical protein